MRVVVLVPYRPDGPHRERAWQHLAGRWRATHPWPVHVADAPTPGWSKGAAVAAAAAAAEPADIAIVADADVWCDEWELAVDAVAAGAPWAIPHQRVHRLTEAGTAAVIATGDWPPRPWERGSAAIFDMYTGAQGGGAVVLRTATLAALPPDPRFVGWGQEDLSWAHALTVAAGRPWRGFSPLWHLWHPPQPRQSRAVGSDAGAELYQRYRREITPDGIARIVAEFSGLAGNVPTKDG